MATEVKTGANLSAELEAKIEEIVQARVAEALKHYLPEQKRTKAKRLAIVASKGSLDMASPPLILATTAVALGWECGVFFTFYGLDVLNRHKLPRLQVSPVGNPAMPEPLKGLPLKVPTVLGALPGMTALATWMMKQWFRRANIPTVEELLDTARESGVQLIACTTTMGVMGVNEKDLYPGVTLAGAAAFLDYAAEADVVLFV